MNISVILSGGVGARFCKEVPKQYHMLNGKEIIAYVVEALRKCNETHRLIIVAAEEDRKRLAGEYNVEVAVSGTTHAQSVKNALDYIKANYPMCIKVLFADSCRPFITPGQAKEYYDILDDYDAVFAAKRITDSLGREGDIYVDRTPYFLIQKPEGFVFDILYENFNANTHTTAIVQQMPSTAKIKKHFTAGLNLKITYPEDVPLAAALMTNWQEGV